MGAWKRNRDILNIRGNEAIVVELERIRDEDERQNKRIALIEEEARETRRLAASVEKLAVQMQDMLAELKEQGERIRSLEEEPADAWKAVKKKALDTGAGIITSALTAGLISLIAQNM